MIRRALLASLGVAFPASLAFASGGEAADPSALYWNLALRAANFALLVGLLVYVFRKYKVMGAVSGQVEGVRRTLSEAEAAEKEARARLAEAEQRMARLQAELDALNAAARDQAERERREIMEEASREIEKIQRDAAVALGQEGKRISEGLRAELAGMVVALAEETLSRNLDANDRKRFVKEYLDQLEGMKR